MYGSCDVKKVNIGIVNIMKVIVTYPKYYDNNVNCYHSLLSMVTTFSSVSIYYYGVNFTWVLWLLIMVYIFETKVLNYKIK